MLNQKNIRLIAPYSIPGIKSTGLWELESYIKNKSIVALDCEGTSLDVFTNKIVMLQIGDINRQFIIDTRYVDVKYVDEWLKDKRIVGHNAKFDYKQMRRHYGWRLLKLYDTMLVEKIIHNNKLEEEDGFYTLASLAQRYLGAEFNPVIKGVGVKRKKKILQEQGSLFPEYSFSKAVRDEFSNIGDAPFTLQQICYGANDVWMPLLIRRKQLKIVSKDNLRETVKLENRYLPVLAETELYGIRLDTEKWMENAERYVKLEEEARLDLEKIEPINWNSSRQVVKVFKKLGIPTEIVDKEKSYGDNVFYKDSVQELHIAKYSKEFPLVKQYLKYKNLSKLVSSYGEKFLNNVHQTTGRIHSNFIQMITTGRQASSSPNLQQIPKGKKGSGFRECFIPDDGYVFIISDYASQESRIIADVAREQAMIEFFNSKETDFHSFTASKMFGVEVRATVTDNEGNILVKGVNEHLRQIGKVLNFLIAYGGSAHKIADAFQIPIKEAEEFITKYFQAYKDLKLYYEYVHKMAKKRGYILIDEYSKRRVYIKHFEEFKRLESFIERFKKNGWVKSVPKKIWSRYYVLKGDIERDAQNYPIQGAGANMTKLAACMFFEWYVEKGLNVRIPLIVHDEIIAECPKSIQKKVAKALKFFMEEAGNSILPNKLVKIIADPVIAEYWAH